MGIKIINLKHQNLKISKSRFRKIEKIKKLEVRQISQIGNFKIKKSENKLIKKNRK